MSAAGSRLIDTVVFVWLCAVRGYGPAVHLAERDILYTVPLALCGARPTKTERGTPTWRIVHAKGVKICNACHARACAQPTRIDWSYVKPRKPRTARRS